MKLTPEQKEEKKLRSSLQTSSNRIRSKWSFGELKTYKDLLENWGTDLRSYFNSELSAKLTFEDVKQFLSDRHIELETSIWLKNNPPSLNHEISIETLQSIQLEIPPRDKLSISPEVRENVEELQKSPKEKAFLFWFQKKAAKRILDNILVHKKHGQLLIASTGYGKTFIAGAVLRRLLDMSFHLGKTFTPWPYVYVTAASVVEQTERVFENSFGIDIQDEVLVINIEQLRSKFGERFVQEKVVIQDGIEYLKWTWRNNIFPCIIMWDESQKLKNLDTQQSKIAQSYNEIASEHTYQVFISATPYTRVIEAMTFAVSTRKMF